MRREQEESKAKEERLAAEKEESKRKREEAAAKKEAENAAADDLAELVNNLSPKVAGLDPTATIFVPPPAQQTNKHRGRDNEGGM